MSDLGIIGGDLSLAPSLAGAASGWANGARALVTTPANGQLAFQRGQLQGAQTASALEMARERRDKNLALQSITPAMLADPGQRNAVLAALIRAERNPAQVANAQKIYQTTDQQGQLFNAALGGAGIADLNAPLAVLHGQPVKISAVEGNTLIDPYAAPNAQSAEGGNVPTAVGLGDIAAANARAVASYASAGASNAREKRDLAGIGADKAANYEIVTDDQGHAVRINKLDPAAAQPVMIGDVPLAMAAKGGAGAAGLKPAPLSPTEATQIFGAPGIKGKATPEFQDFKAWQAQKAATDPRFLNGDFAAQQWALRRQNTNQAINDAVNTSLGGAASRGAGAEENNEDDQVGNSGGMGTLAPTASPKTAPVTIKQSDLKNLPQPKSQADYDALPPGTAYLYTDGTVQVKGG